MTIPPALPDQPLLINMLPVFASELTSLLTQASEELLASQVAELRIVDVCRCGDDFCSSFYTKPTPSGEYGPGHRTIELEPASGMILIDVVGEEIACVEVLHRTDVRRALIAIFPNIFEPK